MIFGSLLCFILAAVLVVNMQTQKELLKERVHAQTVFLGELMVDISSTYLSNMRFAELEVIFEKVNRQSAVAYIYLTDPNGLRLFGVDRQDALKTSATQEKDSLPSGNQTGTSVQLQNVDLESASFPIMRNGEYIGTIGLSLSLEQFYADLRKIQFRNLLAGAFFLLLGSLLCLLVARTLTKPLGQLISHTKLVAGGNFDQKVEMFTNDELEQLASSFNTMMGALRRSMKTVNSLAYRDNLTGLPNRAWFKMHFEGTVESYTEGDRPVAILFLDIDRFKQVNDTLGHNVGDRLLKEFGQRITAAVENAMKATVQNIDSKSDPVASDPEFPAVSRLGGDEFVVVLPLRQDGPDFEVVAQEIIASLATPFVLGESPHIVTTSIGVALLPEHGTTPASLLSNADAAMYQAKNAGRNQYKVFDARTAALDNERTELERELKVALDEDQFCLFFQPQFSVDGGQFTGAEALLRWQHPTRGLLLPKDFIAVAEAIGLMAAIGRCVIRMALKHASTWPTEPGGTAPRLAINSSIQEIEDSTYANFILDELKRTGFDAERLDIEVTESTAMVDSDEIERNLSLLRFAGIRFAVDDFGTGYSNLARLKQLDFEILKIDRSLIDDVGFDSGVDSLVATILQMCRALNLEVVAEGIENWEQMEFLTSIGCDYAQGYSLARPMEADDFVRFIEEYGKLESAADKTA